MKRIALFAELTALILGGVDLPMPKPTIDDETLAEVVKLAYWKRAGAPTYSQATDYNALEVDGILCVPVQPAGNCHIWKGVIDVAPESFCALPNLVKITVTQAPPRVAPKKAPLVLPELELV